MSGSFKESLIKDLRAGNLTPEQAVEKLEIQSTHIADVDFTTEIDPLKCGFQTFEKNYYLRDKQPDLVILAARPGHGKTAMASQIALHVSKTRHSLIFSLEMTKSQIVRRLVMLEKELPANDIKKLTQAQLAAIKHGLEDYNLRVDDANGLDIDTLVARAHDLHRRDPLSLIVVDYTQIVASKQYERRNKIADVVERLKTLAKEICCPVLALAQMNREFEKRVADNPTASPMMSDLADSADIERWADVVLCLHKPYPDLVRVFTVKNRNGEAKDFELKFRGDITKFWDFGQEIVGL